MQRTKQNLSRSIVGVGNMAFRNLISAIGLLSCPTLASASVLAYYDDQESTWQASHIVFVEDGKVKESWKGDLKVSQKLPEGASIFTELVVPGPSPLDPGAEKKPNPVTGRRLVIFLKRGVPFGSEDKKLVWMAARQVQAFNEINAVADVAWVEGERIFTVFQPIRPGGYELEENGSLTSLKQRVDLGIALRSLFDSAKADSDLRKRADRLAALAPTLATYAGTRAVNDCAIELSGCGASAAPIFTRWITDPSGNYQYRVSGLWGLSQLGDLGIDGMISILDSETAYWKAVAAELKGRSVRDVTGKGIYTRVPNHLYHLLAQVRRMKLSEANQERLKSHKGLLELDRLLREVPGMKPEKSDMVEVHKILQDILAGRFRKDE